MYWRFKSIYFLDSVFWRHFPGVVFMMGCDSGESVTRQKHEKQEQIRTTLQMQKQVHWNWYFGSLFNYFLIGN